MAIIRADLSQTVFQGQLPEFAAAVADINGAIRTTDGTVVNGLVVTTNNYIKYSYIVYKNDIIAGDDGTLYYALNNAQAGQPFQISTTLFRGDINSRHPVVYKFQS